MADMSHYGSLTLLKTAVLFKQVMCSLNLYPFQAIFLLYTITSRPQVHFSTHGTQLLLSFRSTLYLCSVSDTALLIYCWIRCRFCCLPRLTCLCYGCCHLTHVSSCFLMSVLNCTWSEASYLAKITLGTDLSWTSFVRHIKPRMI